MLRKLLKWPLRAAVRNPWLRGKIEWELRNGNHGELPVVVPLSHGMSCPIRRAGYVHSFSEVFLNGEYGEFPRQVPLPKRWLDIGCHAGYFSAYLAWRCKRNGADDFSALLIDADPRVEADIEYLIQVNQLESKFKFLAGLIQDGAGSKPFGLRQVMESSSDTRLPADKVATVGIITSAAILEAFPPPYDLIKVDIEGAEFTLIEHYGDVLRQARSLLVEWHSWDIEGTGEARLCDLLGRRGFERTAVIQERKHHLVDGNSLTTGCHLYHAGSRK
jgi:FkbM family methyltransferase